MVIPGKTPVTPSHHPPRRAGFPARRCWGLESPQFCRPVRPGNPQPAPPRLRIKRSPTPAHRPPHTERRMLNVHRRKSMRYSPSCVPAYPTRAPSPPLGKDGMRGIGVTDTTRRLDPVMVSNKHVECSVLISETFPLSFKSKCQRPSPQLAPSAFRIRLRFPLSAFPLSAFSYASILPRPAFPQTPP